ncbi:MAG: sulfatase-like hydrolase/transferase [Planctomycetota bacterium]
MRRSAPFLGLALSALLLLFLTAPSGAAASDGGQEAGAPSGPTEFVVLVLEGVSSADVARVDTPNLDALAPRSMRFDGLQVDPSAPPTRFALTFGAYGSRESIGGAIWPNKAPRGVPVRRIALPQVLATRGYRTALVGRWGLSSQADGFPPESARRFGFQTWRAGRAYDASVVDRRIPRGRDRVDDGQTSPFGEHEGLAVTDAFGAYWSEPSSRPRFALVIVPDTSAVAPPPSALLPADLVVGDDDRSRWDAQTLAADAIVGRVKAAIDPARTTLFVLLEPRATESDTLAAIDGAMLVAGRGVTAGTSPTLCHPVDVPRTILALAGCEVPAGQFEDGVDLSAALGGGTVEHGPVLCRAFEPNGPGPNDSGRSAAVSQDGVVLVTEGAQERAVDLARSPESAPAIPLDDPRLETLRAFPLSIER